MTKLYKQENGIWILQTSDGRGIELVSYDISSKIVDETIYIYNNSNNAPLYIGLISDLSDSAGVSYGTKENLFAQIGDFFVNASSDGEAFIQLESKVDETIVELGALENRVNNLGTEANLEPLNVKVAQLLSDLNGTYVADLAELDNIRHGFIGFSNSLVINSELYTLCYISVSKSKAGYECIQKVYASRDGYYYNIYRIATSSVLWSPWVEIKTGDTKNINLINARVTELEAQRLCYGVEFTRGLDPAMTRWIGNTAYQSSHPVMSMFKVAKVKDGKVTGYFNQVNLFKMEDGTDSNIIIDGTIVTDDGSDVMLVNKSPIYILNGGTNETYERRLVGKVPFVYDGDAAIEIPAHGVCIDYSTIKNGKQRSIRDNTVAGTCGAGVGGISYLANGLGCVKAEVSRFNYELYARAKNTDTTKNVPYCNSFWLDRDVWHTLLCIKFKTKDYYGSAYAGKALSSNDSAPTVSTWGTMTGVRVTETNATFNYYNLSSSRFSSASGQSAVNFWTLLNGQRPLLKMFEAQLALSYAYANSIAPETDFSYDGATYQYANITGHNGLADGEMTAKLRKKVTVGFTGRDVTNLVDVTNMQIDYLLEQVIIKGRVATWGHLYCCTSGIDAWTDNTNYHFYQTSDVNKVTIDADSAEKDLGVKYAFENDSQKVQQIANGEGWVLRMNNNSLIIKDGGGSLHTGECAYSYRLGGATAGKKARKCVFFGGAAHNSNVSSRYAHATNAPTITNTNIAGGFRVELIK